MRPRFPNVFAQKLHLCHVPDCKVPVPRRKLMCLRHWRMVPRHLRADVMKHYRPGQEGDRLPITQEYLDAARAAIRAVLLEEARWAGRVPPA